MEIIEDKISKCKSYVSRQEKFLLAMNNISKDYINDPAISTLCLQEIIDINRNIEFLNNQLNYLNTEKAILSNEEGNKETLQYSTCLDQSSVMGNSLKLRKFTGDGLTIDRISFKIQEIEYKRSVDINLKEGLNKLLKTLNDEESSNSNSKDLSEARRKVEICQLRINLFDRVLARYISLDTIFDLEYKQNHLIWTSPASRSPMTGKLSVKIMSAKNLFKLNYDELYVNLSVDRSIGRQTKPTKGDSWMENFELSVEKANELEFVVFGAKDGSNPAPIGIFWIPIREISEALRVGSFSSAISMHSNGTKSSDKSDDNQQNSSNRDFIESWFAVEPIGQLELKFGFTKVDSTPRTYPKLGRQSAVMKRKDQVIQHNGHNFVIKRFYYPMACALCNEFLMRRSGFQCEECQFLCHKKCGPKVVFKCTSKTSDEADSETINHSISHIFEFTTNISPNWCCHCGYLLPLGKKACKRCKSCNTMAHNDCFYLVPDLCGLSMKKANSILTEICLDKQNRSIKSAFNTNGKDGSSIDHLTQGVNNIPTSVRKTAIEDFHFLAVIGRGNFSKVMLSEEKITKNLFAIKVLKKELFTDSYYLDSLKSERLAFIASNKDRHPFLLGLHSCFQSPSRIYFVMEYIQGGDLMHHIQQKEFTVQQTKFYAIEILLGLEHLHKNNIIYRDLKLDNILLDLDGHIRIADFGLCKENMKHGEITYSICGTPEFLAPEVILEQGYGRAADWWAYGILVYEMRLGFDPFNGSDEDEIYDAILDSEVDYPPCMEREIVSLLQKLLTHDPNYRLGGGPEDAQEIKRHTYFKDVYWDDYLNLRIQPPFKPIVTKNNDTSNFDTLFTNEQPILTPMDIILENHYEKEFEGFSYTGS